MWYGENADIYTTVKKIAYPKPGSANPVVKVKMVDLENLPSNENKVPNTTDLNPPLEFKDTWVSLCDKLHVCYFFKRRVTRHLKKFPKQFQILYACREIILLTKISIPGSFSFPFLKWT